MKKILITVSTILLTIMLIAGTAAGIWLYRKYAPSKVLADTSAWFGVEGDQVAIVFDNELEEDIKGKVVDGQVYLPLTWINDALNERFYWDGGQHQLIYALPDHIVYADASTVGKNGKPLLIETDGEVWLLTELVLAYTDIRVQRYVEEAVKRIFIDTSWDPVSMAVTNKDARIRVADDVKGEILTEIAAGESVTLLNALEKWTKVRTGTGFIGYIQNNFLEDPAEYEQISRFEKPVYQNISLNEPICMVWHQVMTPDANQKMQELMANTKGVNIIAPTWFMLTDNNGNYDSLADMEYVNQAHAMGLQVWAVLDNFNRGENVNSEILFADSKARRKLIQNLMLDVKVFRIDGINLDVEGIKSEAGRHYVQFIRELSIECRKQGIILSVDTYVPSAYTAFYNRAEQGCVADYVVIMGYDEHYAGDDEAGPVASLGYERKGITDTLKEVPANKVISGIPFFTRVWKVTEEGTTSTAMGITAAKQWIEQNGVQLYWQEELGQYYGEKKDGDGMYCVWMEEEKSIGKKMELIKENNLAGVACWKLGFEPQSIWDIVQP